MKTKKAFLSFFAFLATFACMSLCTFANGTSRYKTVISHNTEKKTVRADVYISSGSAIVGYCSFDYDENSLTLLDINGSAVASTVPDFCDDGKTIYLKNIITPHNDIVITDISKGTSKLVSTKDGHVFFAWFLPSSISHIDATENDVLIASLNFAVKDDSIVKESCIVPATKKLTSSVGGWFPGLVVLDKDKKQFSYDGENTGKEYYSYVFSVDGNESVADDETKKDEETDNTQDGEKNSDNTDVNQTQTPNDSDNEQNENTEEKEENKDQTEDKSEEPKEETDENCPSNDNENNTLVPSAKKCDFNIETVCETNQIKIKWTKPNVIKEADSYNIFVYDEDFFLVQKISGISNMSNSYTINGLCGGRTYKIYILAISEKNAYTSHVTEAKTEDYEEYPEVISFTVTYDKSGAYLYGNCSEEVLYGEKLTKIPKVYPTDGKYFVGWSKDKKNVLDVESERIYSNLVLYPVYSEKRIEKIKPYITGYSDGTFKPDGKITRAESATLISKVCEKFSENARYCNTFTDCKSGMWYEKAVSFCASKGYIKGYSDGTFNPDGNITRAEFATVLVRVFGLENVTGIDVFSDLDNHWAKEYVFALYSCGFVKPENDGSFRPDDNITRAEAVMMLNRCLGVIPDREKINSYICENGYIFSDVPHYIDSYYDIMSAVMQ